MAFKDLKGQDKAIELFRNSVNRDRLAHAYLFFGPAGVGKGLFAKSLAKLLNCEKPLKEKGLVVDCCDECVCCRRIDDFNHPDVHWIRSQAQSKRISIDAIRTLQKEISLKAYEGKFKVFIIEEAHEMTAEAANSLLKTLEEPPRGSLLVLTSNNLGRLLPTIISRCQVVKFYLLEYERLKQILIEDYRVKTDNAHFLSIASEGRLGQALDLKEKDSLNKKNRLIEQVCRSERRFSSNDIFNIKDKRGLAIQIKYLLNWFRDILIFKAGVAASSVINADRIEKIEARANSFSFQQLEQIITKIDQAHRLIEQNVNPKIALEVMLEEIAKCRR